MKIKGLSRSDTIGIVIVLAISIVVAQRAYVFHHDFEKSMVSQTQQHLLTIAKTTAKGLEHFINEHAATLSLIAQDPLLQKGIMAGISDESFKEKLGLLKFYYETHQNDVDAIYTLDADGVVLARHPLWEGKKNIGKNFVGKSGISHVLRNHKPYVSRVFRSDEGILAISLLEPVFYEGEFAGIVWWLVSLAKLSQHFIQPVKAGGKGYAQMVDSKGIMLSHPESGHVGRHVMGPRKEAFPDQDWSHLEDIVEKMTNGQEGVGLYSSAWWTEEAPRILRKLTAYAPVHIGDHIWSIGVVMDYSEIERPIHRHAFSTYGVAGVVIFLFGSIGVSLFRTQRIQRDKAEKEAAYLGEIAQKSEVLRKSEEKLAGIISSTTDHMSMIDEDYTIVWTNGVAQDRFGSGLIGRKCYSAYCRNDKPCEPCIVMETFKDGRVHEHETTFPGLEGSRTTFWSTASVAARHNDGRPKLVVEVSRDITDRKQAENRIIRQNEFLNNVIESLTHPFYVIDASDYRIMLSNSAARLGIMSEDSTCYALIHRNSKPCDDPEHPCPLEIIKETKKPVTVEHIHYRENGTSSIVEVHGYPIFDDAGNLDQIIEYNFDITDRKRMEEHIKASLQEKEILLQEIHHRVKNNMQVISSLLNLQAAHITDKNVLELLRESQGRISAMALIHERLYQDADLARIDFGVYLKDLTNSIIRSYGLGPERVTIKLDAEVMPQGIETAIPCGLLVNELVVNSLKHAFPEGRKGEITIVLHSIDENDIELIVRDDGIGMPADLDFRNTESLGLQLVVLLAEEQLQGVIELNRSKGTEFQVCFSMDLRSRGGKENDHSADPHC